MKKSAPSRIVNVTSIIVQMKYYDLQNIDKFVSNFYNYGLSKLCIVLFTLELAKKLEGSGVTTNMLHPGCVETDILKLKSNPPKSICKIARSIIKVFTKSIFSNSQCTS